MSDSTGQAGGTVTAHDPRTDDLQAALEHLAIPVATIIVETADLVARAHLASMGADLMSTYGGSDDADDRVIARLGGYLAQRFGS